MFMFCIPVLKMLNCCIERKKARDDAKKAETTDRSSSTSLYKAAHESAYSTESEKGKYDVGKSWDSWSDSEDEFFECQSDTEELTESTQDATRKQSTKEEAKEAAMLKPDGRLHQFGSLTLLNNGEPLYIPITQVKTTILSSTFFARGSLPKKEHFQGTHSFI